MTSAIKMYLINFSDPASIARSLVFLIGAALAIAFVVAVAASKNDKTKVKKIFAAIGISYVLLSIITLSVFKGMENKEDGGVSSLTFYPMLVFTLIVIATAFVIALGKSKELSKTFIAFSAIALELVVVFLIVYYITGEPNEKNYVSAEDVNDVALWIAAILLSAAIVGLAFLDKRKLKFDARSITYAGVLIALSFALSYIRVVKMPMGGSITLVSLLPIMLYSYMFGAKKGLIVGVVFGVLEAIQDPWILHPAQFLLDYPIAFGGIGLAGILKGGKLNPRLSFPLGALIGTLFRLASHFLSGVFAFGSYAASYDISSPYLYSIAYNATFVLPDAALAIVAGCLLMLNKSFYRMTLNSEGPKIRLGKRK